MNLQLSMSCIVFPSIQQSQVKIAFQQNSLQLHANYKAENHLTQQKWTAMDMAPFSIPNYSELQTRFSKQKFYTDDVEEKKFFSSISFKD